MSKVRVLSDQLANQIAAGEVVERPASVVKELVENSIDAGARRVEIEVEGGGRRLLRIADDGEGMVRDDAVLAFERHATSKITSAEDLNAIATLGFRGEALASISSVARVELISKTAESTTATRIVIEGGRWRDVKETSHPQGTTITVRDLFFNVPARRKFLRSEATENFHLSNIVTHYALANPEIAFTLTNNGRETLHVAPAQDLRERAYQIFGADFIQNLLEVRGGNDRVASITGFTSAPRERRSSRDAQYIFINGRFVRDRLLSGALSEAYRTILPTGVFPAAILFLNVPLEEVDVNVHPAKTEVRFRRSSAVAEAVRDAVRGSLTNAGYLRAGETSNAGERRDQPAKPDGFPVATVVEEDDVLTVRFPVPAKTTVETAPPRRGATNELVPPARQEKIEFGFAVPQENPAHVNPKREAPEKGTTARDLNAILRRAYSESHGIAPEKPKPSSPAEPVKPVVVIVDENTQAITLSASLPPLVSAANLAREVPLESLSHNIRPLGQLDESFIIATDDEGLLLVDQHVAHERILFDKYRALDASRRIDSQHLLMPETFDLTPSQAIAYERAADDLEIYGFGLMRLSGRTVAIKSVPADLPNGEARNVLSEVLDTIESEKRGANQEKLREGIAASLACRAAIQNNTPLAMEKMRWLIDSLLLTSSPTICPHGRPVILRLTTRDIKKSFHRT
jgi:DNA mismatch repair protein MutL